jgi:hypothetical protein
MSPRWDSTPRWTDRLIVGRKETLTLSSSLRRRVSEVSWVCRRSWALTSEDSAVILCKNCLKSCCKSVHCNWVYVCQSPINPVDNPNSVSYSRHTRNSMNTRGMVHRIVGRLLGSLADTLKPSGYYIYHLLQCFKTLCIRPTQYIFVSYDLHNMQQVFP